MPKIDITLPDELAQALAQPMCVDLSLPKPQKLKVQLPSGGTLQAFTDVSKGIPTDCTLTFSLLLQLAPLLASMDCLLKILKLLKPLIDAVTSPPPTPAMSRDAGGRNARVAGGVRVRSKRHPRAPPSPLPRRPHVGLRRERFVAVSSRSGGLERRLHMLTKLTSGADAESLVQEDPLDFRQIRFLAATFRKAHGMNHARR